MCWWIKPKPPVPPVPPVPPPAIDITVEILDFLVAQGDWKAAILNLRGAGAKRIRFIADCNWNWMGTQPWLPADYDEGTAKLIRNKDPNDPKVVVNRGGVMTLVRESGAEFPIYDYTRRNETYWGRLAEVLAYCRANDFGVHLVLTDYCTLKTGGDGKYYSGWYCAKQRMLPGIHDGTWGEEMKKWFANFYKQVLVEVFESAADYHIEDMNEGDCLGWDNAFMADWFKWSNRTLLNLAVPKNRIITSVGRNMDIIAPLGGFRSIHGIGTAAQIDAEFDERPDDVPYGSVIWSSDGFFTGQGGADAKGRRGAGADEAAKIRESVKRIGGRYSILLREVYGQNNDRADVDLMDTAPIMSLAGRL